MINEINLTQKIQELSQFVLSPFYFNSEPLDSPEFPKWGMSLLSAGSMRFRWNEENPNRQKISDFLKKTVLPVELIHSKIVVVAENENDTKMIQADGIITRNPNLVPAITIADCVPIFLFDKETKAFGAFHSGWKGTGICGEGVRKMQETYGSKPENICAAIGPHIGDCCYFVDKSRADYFIENFGKNTIKECADSEIKVENKDFRFRLSLTEANLSVLKNAGVKEENIVVAKDCTCCSTFQNGKNVFGSFRREAAFLPPEIDSETRSKSMTVQSGFTYIL